MKSLIKMIISALAGFLFIAVLKNCSVTEYDTNKVLPAGKDAFITAFPQEVDGVKPQIFKSTDDRFYYAEYKDTAKIRVLFFDSPEDAEDYLILRKTKKDGTVYSQMNREAVSEKTVRKLKVARKGLFTTRDGYSGYYWLNGQKLFTIEAKDKKLLMDIIRKYPYIDIKTNFIKKRVIYFNDISGMIIPSFLVILAVIFLIALRGGLYELFLLFMRKNPKKDTYPTEKQKFIRHLEDFNKKDSLLRLSVQSNGTCYLDWNYTNEKLFSAENKEEMKKVFRTILCFDEKNANVFISDKRRKIVFHESEDSPVSFRKTFRLLPPFPREYRMNKTLLNKGPDEIVYEDIKMKKFRTAVIKKIVKETVLEEGWGWRPALHRPVGLKRLKKEESF